MQVIDFFSEETDFELPEAERYRQWLLGLAFGFGADIDTLNYIFCSDEYLLRINQTYLWHDYYTDIITFDHGLLEPVRPKEAAKAKQLWGDVFISTDRVGENAQSLGLPFETELRRVMAHGLLHLLGFPDKSPEEKQEMRQQENKALQAFA